MKYRLVLCISYMLISIFGYTQCAMGEVEVRVEILTDAFGNETYWTLENINGQNLMQGGQNGVYDGNTSYTHSYCGNENECFLFEIFDTYGDGIFEPAGCELFVNDILVFSGADNINGYASAIVNCANACTLTAQALSDLEGHLNATSVLDASALTLIKNTFILFPSCLASSEQMISQGKDILTNYDTQFGALFTNETTSGGFFKDETQSPGLELERAIFALQQGVFDEVFTGAIYANFPQFFEDWVFNSCVNFPGFVEAPADPTVSYSTLIKANFEDPDGANPYFDISQNSLTQALRPTGVYLAPGSVATVTVPNELVGQGYAVRVGSHDWDLSERTQCLRLDRISKIFPITTTTTTIMNPLGGAISILIPFGADDGIVEVSITNAIQAPFFSLKSFQTTADVDAELAKPAPWAVFESDNVMYTIPKHSIVPGQFDLMQVLTDWEDALRGVNSVLARQIIPDKHNMYMIADLDIRTGVYSIGYPMSNTPINYTDVPGNPYFLNGPGPDDEVNFHEMGHALRVSKFPGEEEAFVNFPYVMALNHGLGQDLNEAVQFSFVPNTFDIDKAATHRIVSNTFGAARDISNTETDEVRYQHRGYAHYFEIVNLLGWCPLRNFFTQEQIDFENGIDHGTNDQNIDSRIIRMSIAAQADLRPLFHVFGLIPQDASAVQLELAQNGIQPSSVVYNRLQQYLNLIPQNNEDFVEYALSVYPNLFTDGPNDNPNYGVGWHYLKSISYDEAEGQSRSEILQGIIDLYFIDGAPNNSAVDVCCALDPIMIDQTDQITSISGGVEPYTVNDVVVGELQTITVTDFNGCTATAEYIINQILEVDRPNLRIYPNPASSNINVEVLDFNQPIRFMLLVSTQGQIVKSYNSNQRSLDLSGIAAGDYVLQITMANGKLHNAHLVILP